MRYALCLLITLGLCLPATGHAQTPPDAGSLLPQVEKERGVVLPRTGVVPVTPAQTPPKAAAGITVSVSTFRFQGNTLLDEAVLARSVASFLGRPLQFAELQVATDAVAQAYRQAGWIVRVYLPPQDIRDGVVTIQVVQALMGAVRIEGALPPRVAAERLLAIVQAIQPHGTPLSARALDRAVLLLNDVPGVRASASLAEGERSQETDLVLSFAPQAMAQGSAGVDNAGVRSTGAERVLASIALDAPLRLGDRWDARLAHSQGSDYVRLGVTLPVGHTGWRVGAEASRYTYKLVSPEFTALGARGSSSSAGVEASYPLIRSRDANLLASLAWDQRRFSNESNGATKSDYRLHAATAGLHGNWRDGWGAGGGTGQASLALVRGSVDVDGSPNEGDAVATGTAGGFTLVRYALGREQFIGDRLSMYAAWAGQAAANNLDSAEKFYLGGASGVRAYPSGEGSGAAGHMINIEARFRPRENITLAGFYDWGQVTVNRSNDFEGAPALNRYSLQGAGVSLGWRAGWGVNLKGTWARRIGGNPNATAGGRDQDGSLVRNRFWFEAGLTF